MKRGFTDLAAESIVPTFPGQTASWIAGEALSHDPSLSVAKNPEQSLANTLNKQVQTGREKRIYRKKLDDGLYHYFPAQPNASVSQSEDVVVQISLSVQELEDINNLVAVGKFRNRNEAVKWLVKEGIKYNRAFLDKVADTKKQIDHLKKELS